ncbi:MAG TPA: SGNH/GDSL hydrolase family protein [Kineosporiaceae bacterium]
MRFGGRMAMGNDVGGDPVRAASDPPAPARLSRRALGAAAVAATTAGLGVTGLAFRRAADGRPPGGDPGGESALSGVRRWHAAVSAARVRKVTGVWIGGSTLEGAVATADTAISHLLEKMLQAAINPQDVSGGYALRVRSWESPHGQTGERLDVDLMKNRVLHPGASVAHSTLQEITGLQLLFLEGPGQGAFRVVLDDRSFVVTPDQGKPAESPTGLWESPVLPRARRTVRIEAIGTCSLGSVLFRDGDVDRGISLHNAGRAGGTTATFVHSASFWARLASLRPDVVPVMLGVNDLAGHVPVEEYEGNLTTIVDAVLARADRAVWIPILGQQSFKPTWPEYLAAMRRVAAARRQASFHTFYPALPRSRAADPGYELMSRDDTHLTSRGHQLAAQVLADSFGIVPISSRTDTTGYVRPFYDWTQDAALLADWNAGNISEGVGQSARAVPSAAGRLGRGLQQADAARRPAVVTGPNGLKALSFAADQRQELSATFHAVSTPATVLVVWKGQGGQATRHFSGTGPDFISGQIDPTTSSYRMDQRAATVSTAPYRPDTGWHVTTYVFDVHAPCRLYPDSYSAATMATTGRPTRFDGFSLGRNQTDTAWADSQIQRVVLIGRALADPEVKALMSALAAQAGLAVAP